MLPEFEETVQYLRQRNEVAFGLKVPSERHLAKVSSFSYLTQLEYALRATRECHLLREMK